MKAASPPSVGEQSKELDVGDEKGEESFEELQELSLEE